MQEEGAIEQLGALLDREMEGDAGLSTILYSLAILSNMARCRE